MDQPTQFFWVTPGSGGTGQNTSDGSFTQTVQIPNQGWLLNFASWQPDPAAPTTPPKAVSAVPDPTTLFAASPGAVRALHRRHPSRMAVPAQS